jgi:solute carrier family 8 (sodium/calcium exchanger)
VSAEDKEAIVKHFLLVLKREETDSLAGVNLRDLKKALEPATLFERFAARRANGIATGNDFVELKNENVEKQMENAKEGLQVINTNPNYGFKCVHYAVTEKAGAVKLCIIKKQKNKEFNFRVATVEGTAKEGTEFKRYKDVHNFASNQDEMFIEVPIIDNQNYQPDLEFTVEIQDTVTGKKVEGDDTACGITILDDDDPGKLSFEETEIKCIKKSGFVEVKIIRTDGADGRISCVMKTDKFFETQEDDDDRALVRNAKEYEDYTPKVRVITFEHGEVDKTV